MLRALRWPRVDRALAELLTYVWEHGNPLPAVSVREFFEKETFAAPSARRVLELVVGLSEPGVPVSIKRASEVDPRLLVRVRARLPKRYRPLFPETCRLLDAWVYGRRRLFDKAQNSNEQLELRPFVRTQKVAPADASLIEAELWSEALRNNGRLDYSSVDALEQHAGRRAGADPAFPLVVDDKVPARFVVATEDGRLIGRARRRARWIAGLRRQRGPVDDGDLGCPRRACRRGLGRCGRSAAQGRQQSRAAYRGDTDGDQQANHHHEAQSAQ